ncbi:MAG: hypothetical protein CBB68_04805 [Rhodospirillaceae bacterium TMED8]|nr:MAG: hypothetical protein CBB68_04805 [Rhodospirillaceae bacterium TMED8]
MITSDKCYVYILGSCDEAGRLRTYVGWTNNLDQRVKRHNAGKGARSTRGRQWKLLYVEMFQSREAAMSREWHLKRDRRLRRDLSLLMGLKKGVHK